MKMTNAEWMLKRGYKFSDLCVCREPLNYKNSIKDGGDWAFHIRLLKANYDEISSEKSLLDALIAWLDAEHKELILDDAEKRYLLAAIGPVKNDVLAIRKVCSAYEDREFIAIIRFFGGINCTFLPDFEPGTMFKGMEPDRWYSLEELGL